jgi:hypothetical protein
MRPVAVLIGLALGLIAGAAGGQTMTGRALLAQCASPAGRAACVAYLRHALATILGEDSNRDEPAVCPPRDLDGESLIRMLIGWAEDGGPEDLDQPAPMVARQALVDAYPCGGE